MTAAAETLAPPSAEFDLVLSRVIDAPAAALYRCWTEPALVKQWFAPKPFTTPVVEMDVRPGGASHIVMRGPDGTDLPNPGIFLEAVPGRRLVFTDAYTAGWVPAAKPFMTAIITFEDLGEGRTRYTATVRHWTREDRDTHEQMGFHEGWGVCADQLAALAATL